MNRLFALLLFACPLLSFGQVPVLTFDEFYQKGKSIDYLLVRDTLDTKQNQLKGENIVWDFRHLNYFKTLEK